MYRYVIFFISIVETAIKHVEITIKSVVNEIVSIVENEFYYIKKAANN